jgi:transketolase
MIDLHKERPDLVFITGDLGYMALENVMQTYKERFINAGVAEQNMLSLAAGMAYEGFSPWVYSIAPFALLRAYEQIRNDICFHNIPVKIVGNGGGYGYGIMGATHHTLEDIAVMRVLPNMKVYVPFLSSDVKEAVEIMAEDPSPNYLRLNLGAKVEYQIESFKPWRKIRDGKKYIVIGTGPVIANIFEAINEDSIEDFEVWIVSLFPANNLPSDLVSSLKEKRKLLTIEEHYGECGLNETLARLLLEKIDFPITYRNIYAQGYPSGRYGNQRWHQEENNLAGAGLKKSIEEFINV